VQVHYDEGVANRIGPESCAVAREGNSEASTGERTGQPLSRESPLISLPQLGLLRAAYNHPESLAPMLDAVRRHLDGGQQPPQIMHGNTISSTIASSWLRGRGGLANRGKDELT
jgi:hypothetical protein